MNALIIVTRMKASSEKEAARERTKGLNEMTELSEELLKKIRRHDPEFLPNLIENSIDLYLEYIDRRGKSEDEARVLTVIEVLDSLDYSPEKE